MTVNDKAMDKIIEKIQKRFRINNIENADKWMITLFMNMPIKDLEDRIKTMGSKWERENAMTDARKHIIEMAKIVLKERQKM